MAEIAASQEELGGVAGQLRYEGNRHYIYAYVAANSALGKPLVLSYDGDEESNPKSAAASTNTSVKALIIFPTKAQGSVAGYQWCQYKGDADVLCDGTNDIAKDDYMEVINAGVALIVDGTSGATTKTANSVAIAQEAYTTDAVALTNVYLLGEMVNIAAA